MKVHMCVCYFLKFVRKSKCVRRQRFTLCENCGKFWHFNVAGVRVLIDFLIRLVTAQDVHFLYTRSHLSALQNCALIFSTNFQFISTFKNALHNLVIELWSAQKYFKTNLRLFIKFTHIFVAIELLTF